ncbi:cell division protein, partial [Enterococcus faecalis]
MGLLLAFSKTWFRFQIISSFLCFALAGLSMFTLARYNKITYKLAVGLSLFYMSTNVIASFSLIQTSSSWASAILPLVFIPAIKMIKDKAQPIQPLI